MLKSHPRLNFYHPILISAPNIFELCQKDDFTQPQKSLFKRNTKNIVLQR